MAESVCWKTRKKIRDRRANFIINFIYYQIKAQIIEDRLIKHSFKME